VFILPKKEGRTAGTYSSSIDEGWRIVRLLSVSSGASIKDDEGAV